MRGFRAPASTTASILDSQDPDPGRAAQRRTTRGARRADRAPADPARRRDRPPPVATRAGQRACPAPVLSHARRGDPGGRPDHAGGGMARRQLPHRGRGRPGDPRGSPARVLPPAPQACRRGAARVSTRARPGLGVRRTHRQPLRSRDAGALRPPIPARAATDHRGAVGRAHRPPDRARGEPAAARRADRRGTCRPPGGRRPGGRAPRPRRTSRPGPSRSEPFDAAALPTAFTVQLVQRLRDQDPESVPGARLARRAARRRRERRPTSSCASSSRTRPP